MRNKNWCDKASELLSHYCIYCVESLDNNKETCSIVNTRSNFTCTREDGHKGSHVGCCYNHRIPCCTWDNLTTSGKNYFQSGKKFY